MTQIYCFGEVLWDVFPNKKAIGGAPLNVAYRLHSLGNNVQIISAVGNDSLGNELISFIEKTGLSSEKILRNEYETGKVIITLDKNNNASYNIKKNAAWDYIAFDNNKIKKSSAFIFGSLAARNSKSRQTLYKLLDKVTYKIFDVNLRPPHYQKNILNDLIKKSDLIKFNEYEILEICKIFGHSENNLESCITFITNYSNAKTICVTKGNNGALLYYNNSFYYNSGFPVKVKDTVGAGDSFLAMLVNELLEKERPELALKKACAIGAMVARKSGANPKINKREFLKFLSIYQ